MNLKFWLLVVLLWSNLLSFSQATFSPTFVDSTGTNYSPTTFASPIDNDVLIAYEIVDSSKFASDTYYSGSSNGVLIARVTTDGDSVWSKIIPNKVEMMGCDYDSTSGKIAVALEYDSAFTLDGFTASATTAARNSVVIQFDKFGTLEWMTVLESQLSASYLTTVTRDVMGDVIVGGELSGSLVVGTDTIFSIGTASKLLLFKLNGTTGDLAWHTISAHSGQIVRLTSDLAGNIYAVADFNTNDAFGGLPIAKGEGILKLDALGNGLIWKRAGDPAVYSYLGKPVDIAFEPGGGLYVTVVWWGGGLQVFDSLALLPYGGTMAILHYDLDLNRNWYRAMTSLLNDFPSPFGRIVVNPAGEATIGFPFRKDVTIDSTTIDLGSSLLTENVLLRIDRFGQFKWVTLTDSEDAIFHSIEMSSDDKVWISGRVRIKALGMFNPYSLGRPFFFGKLDSVENTIDRRLEGLTFIDRNGDLLFSPGTDLVLGDHMVFDVTGISASSNVNGEYVFFADSTLGYQLSSPPPLYHQLVYPSAGFHLIGASPADTSGLDFIYEPIANIQDLEVHTLSAFHVLGQETTYRVVVKNAGTVSTSGQTLLSLDPRYSYIGASPAPDSIVGDIIYWSFNSLEVGDEDVFTAKLFVDTLGFTALDTGCLIAIAEPLALDTTPFNNVDTAKLVVNASYDPNDKLVKAFNISQPDPQGIYPETQTLTYTIRFQNLGTATANKVRIVDVLPPEVVPISIRHIASSHEVEMYFNELGELILLHDPIELPAASMDSAGSQGFVIFSIDLVGGLQTGDSVVNSAAIYFDFNSPVITAPATVTVRGSATTSVSPLAIDELAGLQLYPNPSSGQIFISPDLPASGYPLTIELLDASGKRQYRSEVSSPGLMSLDLRKLGPAGLYTLVVTSSNGARHNKQVLLTTH